MFEQKCQGAVDVISGGDRISGEHVAELAKVLEARLDRGQPQIVLDLQGVALIDSAGLELLLDFQEKCQRMGGALKLASLGALCREVLKATGVGARFEMFRDSGSAVRSFVQ
jgi:anti-anti-sigma factor